jgi:hypothetical protein
MAWKDSEAERWDAHSRGLDMMLEKEEETAARRAELMTYGEDLWQDVEKNKWEVLSRGLETEAGFWEEWLESAEASFSDFDKLTANVAENFSANFGSAFESMVYDATSVGDAVAIMAEGMGRSIVNALGEMAAQWLIYNLVKKGAETAAQASATATMTANAQAMSVMAGLNAFASTAAIPIVGPVAAPGAMAAAIAATQPMAAAVSALMMAGMAHDGIDSVPQTGTWLLKKGERVTTERTSAKLDRKLEEVSGAGVVVNLYEDASKAGQVEQTKANGVTEINIFVSDIMSEGPRAKAMQSAYGLKRRGK